MKQLDERVAKQLESAPRDGYRENREDLQNVGCQRDRKPAIVDIPEVAKRKNKGPEKSIVQSNISAGDETFLKVTEAPAIPSRVKTGQVRQHTHQVIGKEMDTVLEVMLERDSTQKASLSRDVTYNDTDQVQEASPKASENLAEISPMPEITFRLVKKELDSKNVQEIACKSADRVNLLSDTQISPKANSFEDAKGIYGIDHNTQNRVQKPTVPQTEKLEQNLSTETEEAEKKVDVQPHKIIVAAPFESKNLQELSLNAEQSLAKADRIENRGSEMKHIVEQKLVKDGVVKSISESILQNQHNTCLVEETTEWEQEMHEPTHKNHISKSEPEVVKEKSLWKSDTANNLIEYVNESTVNKDRQHRQNQVRAYKGEVGEDWAEQQKIPKMKDTKEAQFMENKEEREHHTLIKESNRAEELPVEISADTHEMTNRKAETPITKAEDTIQQEREVHQYSTDRSKNRVSEPEMTEEVTTSVRERLCNVCVVDNNLQGSSQTTDKREQEKDSNFRYDMLEPIDGELNRDIKEGVNQKSKELIEDDDKGMVETKDCINNTNEKNLIVVTGKGIYGLDKLETNANDTQDIRDERYRDVMDKEQRQKELTEAPNEQKEKFSNLGREEEAVFWNMKLMHELEGPLSPEYNTSTNIVNQDEPSECEKAVDQSGVKGIFLSAEIEMPQEEPTKVEAIVEQDVLRESDLYSVMKNEEKTDTSNNQAGGNEEPFLQKYSKQLVQSEEEVDQINLNSLWSNNKKGEEGSTFEKAEEQENIYLWGADRICEEETQIENIHSLECRLEGINVLGNVQLLEEVAIGEKSFEVNRMKSVDVPNEADSLVEMHLVDKTAEASPEINTKNAHKENLTWINKIGLERTDIVDKAVTKKTPEEDEKVDNNNRDSYREDKPAEVRVDSVIVMQEKVEDKVAKLAFAVDIKDIVTSENEKTKLKETDCKLKIKTNLEDSMKDATLLKDNVQDVLSINKEVKQKNKYSEDIKTLTERVEVSTLEIMKEIVPGRENRDQIENKDENPESPLIKDKIKPKLTSLQVKIQGNIENVLQPVKGNVFKKELLFGPSETKEDVEDAEHGHRQESEPLWTLVKCKEQHDASLNNTENEQGECIGQNSKVLQIVSKPEILPSSGGRGQIKQDSEDIICPIVETLPTHSLCNIPSEAGKTTTDMLLECKCSHSPTSIPGQQRSTEMKTLNKYSGLVGEVCHSL